MHQDRSGGWRPQFSEEFTYVGYDWYPECGCLLLRYRLDDIALQERFDFPLPDSTSRIPVEALSAAFELLFWTAGISYWKAGCPRRVIFAGAGPDGWQASWLNRLFREGLAEFAFLQGLVAQDFTVFASSRPRPPAAMAVGLDDQFLVPMGGGKDSLVAWSRLDRLGRVAATIQVGQSVLIGEVALRAGPRHLRIGRRMDPRLAELNAAGAYNGHVPVTAINATAAVVLALLHGHGSIAFANERSADEPTLVDDTGESVNHQFAKTLAFECMLDDWVRHYIAADLAVFSLLRRDRELAICREFAGLAQFHDVFSSCNRNFHLDGPRTQRWCCNCPKCRFVYLGLAPFLPANGLERIFGADLLADEAQVEGFRRLLALDGHKPFECVGEANEARAVIRRLQDSPEWRQKAVVQALAPLLQGLSVPDIEELCQPGGPHLLPEEVLDES